MNLEYWRTYVDEIEATPVGALLGKASPAVRSALERALLKRELTPEEVDQLRRAVQPRKRRTPAPSPSRSNDAPRRAPANSARPSNAPGRPARKTAARPGNRSGKTR